MPETQMEGGGSGSGGAETPGRLAARLSAVRRTYGSGNTLVHALRGIDLDIRSGELLLLVGPSGCGKTTLLSILAGILDPTEGSVEVFGARLDRLSQSQKTEFRRRNVGFIFQQYNLVPTLTAAENTAIPLLISGEGYSAALDRAREFLGLVGLGDRTEFSPSQLSGGQQQRVAIARALIAEPRLIVCDEPTASLDGDAGQRVMELFRRTALSEDRTIVVVTHDNRIFHHGDRIASMVDGRIRAVDETGNRLN